MDNKLESKKLTLEYVRQLLTKDKKESEIEILSIDEGVGSGRGDNYTSMLYRLMVFGRKRLKSGEWIDWNTGLIYKVLPDSKARREAFKSELLFHNEVGFYNDVWPALNQLQSNCPNVFNGVAKIYTARSDLIVMEDLKPRGYVMADRQKGLDVPQLKLVLKALAGFHALSLTLKELRPDVFNQLSKESIQEGLFRLENEDWYRQYYRTAAKNAISMVSKSLPREFEDRRSEIIGKLKAFLHEDVFFRTMCELTSTNGPFTVFCHGDCWINNILFSSQLHKNNEDIYLVDFQLVRVGSLALDLANILYCCTSGEIRKNYMNSLLHHYHTNLIAALCTLNPQRSDHDSATLWQLLNDEMRRCGRFGIGLAIDILPISTCNNDDAPDLYETNSGINSEMNLSAPPEGGAQCAKLMTDLVIELIQNQAL